MKKIVAIFTCLSILLVGIITPALAENSVNVSGLEECMNKILWRGSDNEEVKLKMVEDYSAYLDELILSVQTYPNFAIMKMGLDPSSDKPLDQQIREEFALDYEKGFLISPVNTAKYLDEYAKAGCFSYLFSNNKAIGIMNEKKQGYETFSTDGERLSGEELKKVYITSSLIFMNEAVFNYLNNSKFLESALIEKGETYVQNIFLFGIGNLTFLYVQGENTEYLIKLYDYESRIIPQIELYKVYNAAEVTNAFHDEILFSRELAKDVIATKPTYSAEAESLQAEGLLKGNENGLDLLKPLTRIEAAAMLLRAMGEDETADTSQVQTFSDVPSEHWGFGAAENAYNLGLVKGVGDDKFAPDESVTAEQFATMVLRAGEEPEFNWEEAINIMIDKGIISQENASTMDFFTRGDMAKIIYEARQNGLLAAA